MHTVECLSLLLGELADAHVVDPEARGQDGVHNLAHMLECIWLDQAQCPAPTTMQKER